MEVKVSVDGVPRVVCGITEETTCHDVVVVLAQARGQPGRYTLREKFKDFERCMTADERLLETLQKYGEQAKEVQLTLLHNGASDEINKTKVGRYQPFPPLRRKDAGPRMRRGSSSLSLHRQSLPPLSCLHPEAEQHKEEVKRPKRKSLTLMEEAWEWLESLGKGRVYSTTGDKESSKKTEKRNRISLNVSLTDDKESRSKVRGQKSFNPDLDQTSCCMGSQTRGKESKHSKKSQDAGSENQTSSRRVSNQYEKECLTETIICQLSNLKNLQTQIACVEKQIFELEELQRAKKAEEEAQQRIVEEEMEQIRLWENELKAEEVYEKDLQRQFLEMKAKAGECKAKLEDYKQRINGLDFFSTHHVDREDSEMEDAKAKISGEDFKRKESDLNLDVNRIRKFLPREDSNPPQALVAPSQIKERRPTGPTELREWWKRWSEAQNPKPQAKKTIVHRSELTIYLGSTKV